MGTSEFFNFFVPVVLVFVLFVSLGPSEFPFSLRCVNHDHPFALLLSIIVFFVSLLSITVFFSSSL